MGGGEQAEDPHRARRHARAALEAALTHYVDVLTSQAPRRAASSPELARVLAAHQARGELTDLGEQQVERAVRDARRRTPNGHTWAEIGTALGGISSQAVGKWVRQRGLDTTRSVAPSPAAVARAEQAQQRRAQRAVTRALTEAATRWPGRRLRRVDHADGTVTFEPIPDDTSPPPTSPARPARHYRDARDRAVRMMAGGEVFRPELVRHDPGSPPATPPRHRRNR